MGACLSCLLPSNEDDFNETTSLLRNQENQYVNNYGQEEQILEQQQRQQELATIVNELSDKLIDVTSFLNTSVTNSPNLTKNNIEDEVNSIEDQGKSFPYVYNNNDKTRVVKAIEELDDEIRQACQVKLSDPLYLKF